ncbi:MAG: GNAT family N-acetyltransferase [Stappiaceae bacterium]
MTSSAVTLRPMTDAEYQKWYDHCVLEYAKDKMVALDTTHEQALKLSEDSFKEDLPNAMDTPDNYLYSVVAANGVVVGSLWIAMLTGLGRKTAFIYDIEIAPEYRRQGFGEVTLRLLEDEARKLGASKIGLHVFGHNPGARALYEKMDYRVTDISMAKAI